MRDSSNGTTKSSHFSQTYPIPPEGLSIRLHDGPLYDLADAEEASTHFPPTNHPTNNIAFNNTALYI